ncbi:MAG: hypothetical protein RJB66_900 [Pseudomonadota bacterium]
MKKSSLKSQAGDALVTALIAVALVAGLAVMASSISKVINDRKTIARAKSIMTSVQQKMVDLASEPSSYNNCDTVSGVASCTLNVAAFSAYTDKPTVVPGSQCESGQIDCGIVVDQLSLDKVDASKPLFKARIRYTGVNFSLHPIEISQVIPKEVLQAIDYDCFKSDPGKPLYTGIFTADGRPRCRGIPTCGDGKFIDAVNPSTLEPHCQDLPNPVTCEITHFVSSFTWTGGINATFDCAARVDPYTVPQWWDGGTIVAGVTPPGPPKVNPPTPTPPPVVAKGSIWILTNGGQAARLAGAPFQTSLSWTVPKGVSKITITAIGGGGSGGSGSDQRGEPDGGYRGKVELKTIAVKEGDIIQVTIGSGGVPVPVGMGRFGNDGQPTIVIRNGVEVARGKGGGGGAPISIYSPGFGESLSFRGKRIGVGGSYGMGGPGGAGQFIGAGGGGTDHVHGYYAESGKGAPGAVLIEW